MGFLIKGLAFPSRNIITFSSRSQISYKLLLLNLKHVVINIFNSPFENALQIFWTFDEG